MVSSLSRLGGEGVNVLFSNETHLSLGDRNMAALETLAAVVVGGLIAPFGNIIVGIWEDRKRRDNLSAALSAEIAAILAVSERRGHEQFFEGFLEDWKAGRNLDVNPGIHGAFDQADPVFVGSVNQIGLLGHTVAADVGLFYTTIKGIRQDIIAMGQGDIPDVEHRIKLVEEDLGLWREMKTLGASLVSRLQRS